MSKSPEQPYNIEQAEEEASILQEKIKSGKAKTYIEAEKLVEKEKEGKPFFFIYRENDLFKKYVPLIQNFLEEKGYLVNLQSFPAGTSEEEIKSWYLAHQVELQSKNILADYTSKKSSGYDEKDFKNNLKPKINLDDLLYSATIEAITGDASLAKQLKDNVYESRNNPEIHLEVKQEYLSALGEIYKNILTSIPEEQRQKMEIVILKGLFIGKGEKGNVVFPPLIAHEPYVPDGENFEELSIETDDFANRMKGWLGEAGISNTTIFSTGAEIPAETIRKLIEGSAYIIFDRHTFTTDISTGINLGPELSKNMRAFWGSNARDSGSVKRTAALQTPVETFYSDIQKKIGINADPQKMEELIKKRLQEELTELEK